MIIQSERIIIVCGECGSRNIARRIPGPYEAQGRLICIDCGHEEAKKKAEDLTNAVVYTDSPTPRKVTF